MNSRETQIRHILSAYSGTGTGTDIDQVTRDVMGVVEPSSDLDERLNTLIDGFMNKAHSAGRRGYAATWDDSYREQIKQCFIDAGWLRTVDVSTPAQKPYTPEPRMTGAEWYERFKEELGEPSLTNEGYYAVLHQSALDAAKKASGII